MLSVVACSAKQGDSQTSSDAGSTPDDSAVNRDAAIPDNASTRSGSDISASFERSPATTDAKPTQGVSDEPATPKPEATGSAESIPVAPEGSLAIPARIEAEEFVRFNETDAPMDASDCGDGRVDMGLTDDEGGECYIGWTQGGEWVEYDVWSESPNVYSITLRLASGDPDRVVSVLIDGDEVGRVETTGQGWTEFEDAVLDGVALSAGVHTVRVAFVSGQTNFNYVVFEAENELVTVPTGNDTSSSPSATTDENQDSTDIAVPGGDGCAAAAAGYQLVWSDEFDYEGLPDPERWGYEVGGDGWGNGELQYYTDARQENASVSDGVLTITAIAEPYEGNEYSSAKLNSAYGLVNPGSWNEGIIRIRARLPKGLGTWPALWMMPNNCTEGWPACGEIDVMEHVGYDEGTVHGTIHTDAFNHIEGTQLGQSVMVDDATSEFHEYAFIWQTERLQWLVDGETYYTIDKEPSWSFAEWPFNEKSWHLKVNLAVGGAWGGAEGVNREDFPTQFEIDHVCVYQTAQ